MGIDQKIQQSINLFNKQQYQQAIDILKEIDTKQASIQQKRNIEYWFGRCYFEKAKKSEKTESQALFEQAIKHFDKSLTLAEQLEDKQECVRKQRIAKHWLGRCYLEQAQKSEKTASQALFEQAIKHFDKSLTLAERLEDKQERVRKQNTAEHWLGHCYLAQTQKAENTESQALFEQAIKHFDKSLTLAERLEDKQESVREQRIAKHWLGRCYLEQAQKSEKTASQALFEQAIKHFEESLTLAKRLEDKQERVRKQNTAEHWLGRCYFEQAKKAENTESQALFEQAIKHFEESLTLAGQLEGQEKVRMQRIAENWLGHSYLAQAQKAEKTASQALFEQAIKHFEESLTLAGLLEGQEKVRMQRIAEHWLGRCYLTQANKANKTESKELFDKYIEAKIRLIKLDAVDLNSPENELENSIYRILALLSVSPMEFGKQAFAHYTSANVCNILFNLNDTQDKKGSQGEESTKKTDTSTYLRMNSCTYMNDPLEGKSLLELLNQQDLQLDNKIEFNQRNAFFCCFSSRVNDLNQFRLYGKEDGVEASGCCLVFNKDGKWLSEPSVKGLLSPRSIEDKSEIPSIEDENTIERTLYQVAYIAYLGDQYIDKTDICEIGQSSFGVYLKCTNSKEEWNDFRRKELAIELEKLIAHFNKPTEKDKKDSGSSANSNDKPTEKDDKESLEMIRYLFKDYAFRDEDEFRIIELADISSQDKIKYCEITKSLYLPYISAAEKVNEVILGTNYEKTGSKRKAEVFRYFMQKKHKEIKVSQSTLPINAK